MFSSFYVNMRALSRSHFLIDIHQNWHRRKNPYRRESISHHPFLYLVSQNSHFRPRGPENPCEH